MPQQQQDAAAALAAAPPPRDTAAVEAQIRQLERAAMEAHGAAQQLNNCGRFEGVFGGGQGAGPQQ